MEGNEPLTGQEVPQQSIVRIWSMSKVEEYLWEFAQKGQEMGSGALAACAQSRLTPPPFNFPRLTPPLSISLLSLLVPHTLGEAQLKSSKVTASPPLPPVHWLALLQACRSLRLPNCLPMDWHCSVNSVFNHGTCGCRGSMGMSQQWRPWWWYGCKSSPAGGIRIANTNKSAIERIKHCNNFVLLDFRSVRCQPIWLATCSGTTLESSEFED